MAGIIEKGDLFCERRRAVETLLPLAGQHTPELVPDLQALLEADWIERDDLRRVKWRWWKRRFFSPGRLVR
ncbi:hypothetical protein ACFOPQ_17860 [Deinococcus antarcticus]|uniref:Uncharacterized protein n=1 Tax=Deinococcus antarcticus TaxID=1298767 RepID=A0ABV8AB04_9DEIO